MMPLALMASDLSFLKKKKKMTFREISYLGSGKGKNPNYLFGRLYSLKSSK